MKGLGKIHRAALNGDPWMGKTNVLRYVSVVRTSETEGRAIATDGYVLAIREVELAPEEAVGLIPAAALSEVARSPKASSIEFDGKVAVVTSKNWGYEKRFEPSDGNFPSTSAVYTPPTEYATLTLNAEKLLQLADAIGPDHCLTLRLPIGLKAGDEILKAVAVDTDHGYGMIMPVRDTLGKNRNARKK